MVFFIRISRDFHDVAPGLRLDGIVHQLRDGAGVPLYPESRVARMNLSRAMMEKSSERAIARASHSARRAAGMDSRNFRRCLIAAELRVDLVSHGFHGKVLFVLIVILCDFP